MIYRLTVLTDSTRQAVRLRRTWVQVNSEDDAVHQAIVYSGTELRVDLIRVR